MTRDEAAAQQIHPVIWLQPWCDMCNRSSCAGDGRMWCQDQVFDPCEECGRQPVKYVLAPDQLAKQEGEQT